MKEDERGGAYNTYMWG